MSNHSGIGVSPQLAGELAEFAKGTERALILEIVDEKCQLAEHVAGSSDLRGDARQLAARLEARQVAYALVQIGEKYVFGCFIPDEASSRDKMIYASSAELIRKQLPVASTAQRWADYEDVETELGSASSSTSGPGASALTKQEVEERRLGTEEKTRQVPRQSGANVSLALPKEAEAALQALEAGSFISLVVRGEQLHMQQSACGLQASSLEAKFGPEPTYAVYCDNSDKKWFIYRCPDDASAKERMIAASCRNGVVETINGLVQIDSTIETSDEIEFPKEENTPAPASEFIGTEVRKLRRPAKPGRVSRR